jgi:hypothetical protein
MGGGDGKRENSNVFAIVDVSCALVSVETEGHLHFLQPFGVRQGACMSGASNA